MKKSNEMEQLLDDVLRSEELDAFKKSLQLRCHEELARKRRKKLLWLLPAAASVLFALWMIHSWILEKDIPGPGPESPSGPRGPAYLVSSVSLTASQLVSTTPIPKSHLIRTGKIEDLLASSSLPLEVVHTDPANPVEKLTDRQVFDLFPNIPCGLVQAGENIKRLIFFNPEHEARFFGLN